MTEIPLTEMLLDAIVGAGFPDDAFGLRCVAHGVARFTGNQHNEDFTWDRDALRASMPEDELQLLYYSIKNFKALAATHPPYANPGA